MTEAVLQVQVGTLVHKGVYLQWTRTALAQAAGPMAWPHPLPGAGGTRGITSLLRFFCIRRSCSSSRVLSFHANAAHQQPANMHQNPGGQQQQQQPEQAAGEPAGNASSSHANGSKPRNAQGQDAQDGE